VGVGEIVLLGLALLLLLGVELVQLLVLLSLHLLEVGLVRIDHLGDLVAQFLVFVVFAFALGLECQQELLLAVGVLPLLDLLVLLLLEFLGFLVQLQLLDSFFLLLNFQFPFLLHLVDGVSVALHFLALLLFKLFLLVDDFAVDFLVFEFVVVDFIVESAFLLLVVLGKLLFEEVQLYDGVEFKFLEFVFLPADDEFVLLVLLLVHQDHFVVAAPRVLEFVEIVCILGVDDLPEDDTAILTRSQQVDAVFSQSEARHALVVRLLVLELAHALEVVEVLGLVLKAERAQLVLLHDAREELALVGGNDDLADCVLAFQFQLGHFVSNHLQRLAVAQSQDRFRVLGDFNVVYFHVFFCLHFFEILFTLVLLVFVEFREEIPEDCDPQLVG